MIPKFSIIIPVYNLENYIKQCLDSLIIQNFQSWEGIIINDGSFDKSLEILKSYVAKDNRFKIIDKPNEGLSAARNDAISICSGDYIVFLDGDDWLEQNAFEEFCIIIDNFLPDVFIHNMNYFYSDDKIIRQSTKIQNGSYNGMKFLHKVLKNKEYFHFVSPSKVYKKDFIINNNLIFERGIIHEDGPFFFDVCKNAEKVYYSRETLYNYRQLREGSITSTNTIKNFEGLMFGINKCIQLFSFKDKIVNGAMLNILSFLVSEYKTLEDRKLAFKKLRQLKSKVLITRLLFISKADFNVYLKGFILVIEPLLLYFIYKIWFFKNK